MIQGSSPAHPDRLQATPAIGQFWRQVHRGRKLSRHLRSLLLHPLLGWTRCQSIRLTWRYPTAILSVCAPDRLPVLIHFTFPIAWCSFWNQVHQSGNPHISLFESEHERLDVTAHLPFAPVMIGAVMVLLQDRPDAEGPSAFPPVHLATDHPETDEDEGDENGGVQQKPRRNWAQKDLAQC